MATTHDLTGGSTAKLSPGPTVLRSALISAVGAVVNDVWRLFKLPAKSRVLSCNIEVVADGVGSSLWDVGFDGGAEISGDIDANATAVTNGVICDRIETAKYLTVKADTMATAPTEGSFRVSALVVQM